MLQSKLFYFAKILNREELEFFIFNRGGKFSLPQSPLKEKLKIL
jgi:hypothetical protein